MRGNILGLSFVLVVALLEAGGLTFFKRAAESNKHGMRPLALLRGLWRDRRILFGIVFFILAAILWTLTLSLLPVSIAFPAASISFVFVALFSLFFLGEQIKIKRWIGIALILGGVILVGL